VYALAFLIGLVLGPVLGFAQWLALRRYVRGASLRMPANALAWAFGMVVIFAGIEPAMGGGFGLRALGIVVFTLACAGAVVGAIHGPRSSVYCARCAWSGASAKAIGLGNTPY
jgi:hypothetical protein